MDPGGLQAPFLGLSSPCRLLAAGCVVSNSVQHLEMSVLIRCCSLKPSAVISQPGGRETQLLLVPNRRGLAQPAILWAPGELEARSDWAAEGSQSSQLAGCLWSCKEVAQLVAKEVLLLHRAMLS